MPRPPPYITMWFTSCYLISGVCCPLVTRIVLTRKPRRQTLFYQALAIPFIYLFCIILYSLQCLQRVTIANQCNVTLYTCIYSFS